MKLELKGSAITVMGRLDGMSKAQAWEQIKAGGGKVRKTLANSTDILVMGKMLYASDDEKNREKAKLNGTAVINCAQFAKLLEQGKLIVGGKKATFEGDADVEESIGRFRGLFDQMPTTETWQQICDLLDSTHPDALDVVVDYVVSHLEPYKPRWDAPKGYNIYGKRTHTPVFEPPETWLQDLFSGAYSPKFRVLKKIGLYDLKLTGKPTKSLISCPHLEHVTQMDLGWNKLPQGFYAHLGKMEHLSQLTHLSFENNPFPQKAAVGLAANDNFPQLKFLSLKRCYLKDGGVLETLFGDGAFASLEELDLDHNDSLRDVDLQVLANASQLTNLRTLKMPLCRGISGDGVGALLAAPHMAQLEALNLSYNDIDNLGSLLRDADHLQSLSRLDLYSCDLHDQDVHAIAESPHLASLRELKLGSSGITTDALIALLQSPYLADVHRLDLTGTSPESCDTNAVLLALAEIDQLAKLTHLSLSGNAGDEGVKAFANAPHVASLTYCYLGEMPRSCRSIINNSPYLQDEAKQSLVDYCKL